MSLPLDHLDLLDEPSTAAPAGTPLMLPIDLIDEDPDQPRTEFDDASLSELAATIAERGVRQPVSVRCHPMRPERWMLNFGARRLRASRLAGKGKIPAFVDNAADSYDQVIENEQREGLKPLEFALFVQRRLAAGDSRAEIARRLGKSASLVTYACALIDAPDWLMAAYREGRCRGLRELYELRRTHDEGGAGVAGWVATQPHLSRDAIAEQRANARAAGSDHTTPPTCGTDEQARPPHVGPTRQGSRQTGDAGVVVEAEYRGERVLVLTRAVPAEPLSVYVTTGGGSNRRQVSLVELLHLVLRRS